MTAIPTIPLLHRADLTYAGAFGLPRDPAFSFAGHPIAYHQGTLYVGTRSHEVAQITIPDLATVTDPRELPRAEILQPFADPFDGRLADVAEPGLVSLAHLLVYDDRLYATVSVYYDADNRQRLAIGSRSLDLADKDFGGFESIWRADRTGYVAGYLAEVPPAWVSALRGPAVCGQFGIPIVTRTSYGPALFAFDPDYEGFDGVLPAVPLVYYDSDHPTLGPWQGSNRVYGGTTTAAGVVLVPGTSSALFFGSNGVGPFGYGPGLSDPKDPRIGHPTAPGSGETYCYDPTSADKGQHAYPYQYQVWAYDLHDLAAVAAGEREPWSVVPYDVWNFELPIPEPSVRLGGVTFDPESGTIYLTQSRGDPDGYASRAVVHAFRVNVGTAEPAEPPVVIPPIAVDDGGPAADASLQDKFAGDALAGDGTATPEQAFDRAAQMVAESRKRKGPPHD